MTWFYRLCTLTLLLLLWPTTAEAVTPTTWTENWANLTQWHNVDAPCFTAESGTLHGVCQSAAFQSLKKWSPTQPITVSSNMIGKPTVGSSTSEYFVGLTLWQREDSARNSNYLEVALVNHVPPFTANTHNRIGALASPNTGTWNVASYVLWDPGPTPGTVAALKLKWTPTSRWDAYWGTKTAFVTKNPFVANLPVYVRLLVVCVGEGVGDNGCRAEGVFGPLTVIGTQV